MANRYWVGGSGTWDATTTTNWSATSGGAGGASAPTSADNVIFNSASNATLYTVTVGTNAACLDLTAAGPASGNVTFSLGATAVINCYGSFTLPATGLTWTVTLGAIVNFLATSTGKTVTTNGVSLGATALTFNGVGGGWTLGSAITTTNRITVTNGTFDTSSVGNYSVTVSTGLVTPAGTKTINLNASTVTTSGSTPLSFVTAGLTFNAGTSTINCSGTSPTNFGGDGPITFYNVSFTSTALGTATITGANTYNNLTFAARAAAGLGIVTFDSNQTVNGTLTLGSGTTGSRRLSLQSSVVGTPRTLTVATLAAPTDVDFRDIIAAGASAPWSGTRLGNCLGNSNITFAAGKTVYWNLAAGGAWSAVAWATSSGGTAVDTNFPLAQDTAIIENTGLTTGNTITLGAFNMGTLNMSTRSNAMTLANSSSTTRIYGDVIFSSAVTNTTSSGGFIFNGQGITQKLTTAGITINGFITEDSATGTLQLQDNCTVALTISTGLVSGTLDLNNKTLSTGLFNSNGSITRAIAFGTGNITLTGNNTTLLSMNTATGFTYTGTPTVNFTYSGSVGTRTVNTGTTGLVESNALNFNVTGGTDALTLAGNSKNLNFTGFSGTLGSSNRIIYGNLTISSGMTLTAGGNSQTFAATTGTQQITTNGNATIDFPIIFSGTATYQLQDNLTTGATRTVTLTSGTLDLNNKVLSAGVFSSSNSNTRSISFGTSGKIQVTGSNTSVLSTSIATNFSYTGTSRIELTYSGSVGTRSMITNSILFNGIEANSLNVYITAGSDIVELNTLANRTFKTLDFTGFSGSLTSTAQPVIYGNLVYSSAMTIPASTATILFAATSGTQLITTAGKTLDFPLTFNGLGGTFAFQDALTMGSTRTLTLNAGNLLFKSGTTNTVGNIVLSGNDSSNTRLSATEQQFAAFLQKVVGGNITASNITIENSYVTPENTWFGNSTTIDGGNNTNWTFEQTAIRGHDAFLPQEIRHFKDLDRKAKAAEAARIRAVKLMAYHRKRRFKELLAPELINPQEESFYEQLREEQFPEQVAKEKAEKATAEEKAKVEAKKSEIKKELKRLQKEEKEAEAKVVQLQREKELLIESVIARQKAAELQAQLAIIEKLRQEEMEDEQALLLLI
jgi:hypothetical protein